MATPLRAPIAAVLFLLAANTLAFTQEPPQDLGAAARDAHAGKRVRAKVIISNENIEKHDSPFPDLNLDDPKGAEAILKNVQEFKSTHTPEETEAAVRTWFKQNDDQLESLLVQIKVLTDAERSRSEARGEPESDLVNRSTDLQQQLRSILDALNDSSTESKTPPLPKAPSVN